MGAPATHTGTNIPGTAPAPTVTLQPDGSTWAALCRRRAAQSSINADAKQFRRELGLPSDSPLIMSGHQAQWWHAGILAKQMALTAACRQVGPNAADAWIVVDQDASDSLRISYPAAPASGTLPSRATWAIAPETLAAQLRADVALTDLPAFTPADAPVDGATPDINRGLRAIADSASRWAGAATAAEQIARANAELSAAALGSSPPLVFATTLLRTSAGRGLLEKMADDPARCVAAYNDAVKSSGVRTIAPLSFVPEKSRYELPLWQLSGKSGNKPSPRKRVFASSLGDTPLDTLAPRGVMMSGLLRWLGCDLFIHGTGGGATGEEGGYDKVAELWMNLWLGVDLAPSVVATATALLPMGTASVASEHDLYAAHRRVENARHAPRSLGDTQAQHDKDSIVARIAATTDGVERHRLYRQLQAHLDRYRTAHTAEITAATASIAETAAEVQRHAILRERTWPWPLLPRPELLRLQRTLAAQMEG